MAAYVKFQQFVEDLGLKLHDLNTDQFMVYLTNNAPSVSADAVLADLVGITEENGYAAADILNTFSQTGGVGTFAGTDKVWTASGGTFGPFRYAVIRNETQISPLKPLVAYYDYGAEITVQDGYPFTVNFGSNVFTLT